MITFLRGTIVSCSEKCLVLDVGGVGFQIGISARDAGRMPQRGQELTIHTYMSVREDDLSLFGFLDPDDLAMYRMLVGVSGIGPKGALGILSFLSADQLRFSILAGDAKTIAKSPGIGAKTAQKLILELKDKIDVGDTLSGGSLEGSSMMQDADSQAADDAVAALVSLGYSGAEALKAVRGVKDAADLDTEQLLKAALKNLF